MSKWEGLEEVHKNFVHPKLEAKRFDFNCHNVLEWNREQGLYVLPLQDYDMNNGSVLLSDNSIRMILTSVGKALVSLHKSGISHGLVTPENILIDNDGGIKLSGLENTYSRYVEDIVVTEQTLDSVKREILDEFVPPEALKKIAKGKLSRYEPT